MHPGPLLISRTLARHGFQRLSLPFSIAPQCSLNTLDAAVILREHLHFMGARKTVRRLPYSLRRSGGPSFIRQLAHWWFFGPGGWSWWLGHNHQIPLFLLSGSEGCNMHICYNLVLWSFKAVVNVKR